MTSFFGAVGHLCLCVLQDEAGIFRWPLRSKLAHSPGNLEELDKWIPVTTLSALWASFDLSFKHLTNYECVEIWDIRVSESKRNSLRKKKDSPKKSVELDGTVRKKHQLWAPKHCLELTALPFPHTKSYQFAQAKVFFQKKDE